MEALEVALSYEMAGDYDSYQIFTLSYFLSALVHFISFGPIHLAADITNC